VPVDALIFLGCMEKPGHSDDGKAPRSWLAEAVGTFGAPTAYGYSAFGLSESPNSSGKVERMVPPPVLTT